MRQIVLYLLTAALLCAQEATIAPSENLVTDGIEKIPASLAENASRYSAYRGATFLDWQAVGRSMLIATRFGDTTQLHLLNHPQGARQQLTFFADPVSNASFPPLNIAFLVFSKDNGGGEWYQLYRYDFSSGDVTLLTDGKSRNLLGPWSSAGDRFAYMSTRRTGKDTDLWVMNPSDPHSDRLLTKLSGGGWEPLAWSPDDKRILLVEYLSVNESYLWLVDTTTGDKTPLLPRDVKEKVSYAGGKFSKDGKGIFVTTDRDSEFHRLAYVDLDTKQHKYLTTPIPWDIEAFDLSPDGSQIVFSSNEEGLSKIYLMDANKTFGADTRQATIPPGVITALRWDKSGQEIGFSLTNAQTPGTVFSLVAANLRLVLWTLSESAVKTDSFPSASLVEWKSFDDRKISGFLYKPPAKFTGKRPVMVVIHGGPEGESQPVFLGRNNYFLNELGIALIFPNVRGSTGFGKSFSLLDNGFHRDDTYKDIDALFDWIAQQPDLDASRIAVTGGSYGGHMTLAVSTFYSDRIRCSVDIVGMSNLVTFLEHTEAYRRDLRRVEYGDERDVKMREYLEHIAPMNNIGKIKKPMMVVAGKNDPRVPVSESEQIMQALKQQGTPVWYLMAKDEGHGFRKKPNVDFQFYTTVEFLKKYLLN